MIQVFFKRDIRGNIYKWSVDISSLSDTMHNIICAYGILNGTEISTIYESVESYTHAVYLKDALVLRKKRLGYKSMDDIIDINNAGRGAADKKLCIAEINAIGISKYIDMYLPKYNTTIDDLVKPMKCQKYSAKLFKNGMIGQPKVNGVRATIQWIEDKGKDLFDNSSVHILSKEGLRYRIAHIENWFAQFVFNSDDNKELVFDGEIYIHGEKVTTIGGAARNTKNPNHTRLQFVAFDLAIPDIIQSDRIAILAQIIDDYSGYRHSGEVSTGHYDFNESFRTHGMQGVGTDSYLQKRPVYLLHYRPIVSADAAFAFMEYMISKGFEGAVFRDPNALYCFGQRPKTMIKLKKYEDAEFKIINIDLQDSINGSDIGVALLYTLKNDLDDQTFICSGEGTANEKRTIFANKDQYIGEMATVKFYERTINTIPFHANVIAIRNYEKPCM